MQPQPQRGHLQQPQDEVQPGQMQQHPQDEVQPQQTQQPQDEVQPQQPPQQQDEDSFIRDNWQVEELAAPPIRHDWLAAMGVFQTAAPQYMQRSALGLVSIYNLLPPDVVLCSPSVAIFQGKLQDMMKARAAQGHEDWTHLFSPRWQLLHHPLRQMRQSENARRIMT